MNPRTSRVVDGRACTPARHDPPHPGRTIRGEPRGSVRARRPLLAPSPGVEPHRNGGIRPGGGEDSRRRGIHLPRMLSAGSVPDDLTGRQGGGVRAHFRPKPNRLSVIRYDNQGQPFPFVHRLAADGAPLSLGSCFPSPQAGDRDRTLIA